VTHRSGLLIQGPAGWGEFAPFDDYDAVRSGYWLAAALESAFLGWPKLVHKQVRVNAIMPVRSQNQTHEIARDLITKYGCRTIKVKVADPRETADNEWERVAVIRAALDEQWPDGSGRIRLDANAGWSLAEATSRLTALAKLGIEYAEQPCRSLQDLAVLHDRATVPIAVDETLRIDRVFADVSRFADVAIVKVAPLGGFAATLAVAEQLDVPVVVSGAMESSIGLSASVATAAALPESPHDHGLGTGALLASDLVVPTLVPASGKITPRVVSPDPKLLQQACARCSQQDIQRWSGRLSKALLHVSDDILQLV
jgi:O-succinylbenzoate synthase